MQILPALNFASTNQEQQPVLMLYYSPTCVYSRKVLRFLDSIERTVPMKNVAGNPEASAELLRLGGKKQVPCLIIDGIPLYETDAIIAWLQLHQDSLLPKKPTSAILNRHDRILR